MSDYVFSLEECISKLENNAYLLKSGTLSLDDSIKVYTESVDLFEYANTLLKNTQQKIRLYNPENKQLEDFDVQL